MGRKKSIVDPADITLVNGADGAILTSLTPELEEVVVVEVQPRKLDETIPGGRYIVNGVLVDCNNKPIKDSNEEIKEA